MKANVQRNPEENNMWMTDFLIYYMYVKSVKRAFRHELRIPMGTKCAPRFVDLFLCACEFEFLIALAKIKTREEGKKVYCKVRGYDLSRT